MGILPADDPRAVAMTAAIQGGDIAALRCLLEAHPDLANMPIANNTGVARTPVLVATDWPGHFPQVATTLSTPAAAGADMNVRLPPHPKDPSCIETPLHQAASSNDVAAIDALLDAGADINATGAIFTAGGPLSDAVIFANWAAADILGPLWTSIYGHSRQVSSSVRSLDIHVHGRPQCRWCRGAAEALFLVAHRQQENDPATPR